MKPTLLVITILLTTLGLASNARAQGGDATVTSSASDERTPTALEAGTHPLGSFGGSDFDSVNLFNGNLAMTIPLVSLGGRNGAGVGLSLSYNAKTWRVERQDVFTKPSETPTGSTFNATRKSIDGSEPVLRPGWKFNEGRAFFRYSGYAPVPHCNNTTKFYSAVMTRLTFTSPDGTEYELIDEWTNGAPQPLDGGGCDPKTGRSRGRVWRTVDGTAATFVSDTVIFDFPLGPFVDPVNDIGPVPATGWMYLRDGSRMRLDNGFVVSRQDSNGNVVNYTYELDAMNKPVGNLIGLTDSLGRTISIAYNPTAGVLARITWAGIGGATKTIDILKASMSTALRSDMAILDGSQLFLGAGYTAGPFDPSVISGIRLQSGHEWKFKYNSWAEIARVEMPSGGAIEYDFAEDFTDGGGNPTHGVIPQVQYGNSIFRRVERRKVYPNGGTTTADLEHKTSYSNPATQPVVEQQLDAAGNVLAKTEHWFYGSPLDGLTKTYGVTIGVTNTKLKPWKDGREYKTVRFDQGTPKQTAEMEWTQVDDFTWVGGSPAVDNYPANGSRVATQTTTLREGTSATLVSKVETEYDDDPLRDYNFNNVKWQTVYDFGSGAPGAPVRRSASTYETSVAYTDVGVISDPDSTAHLRSLVTSTEVQRYKSGSWDPETRVEMEYDVYNTSTGHAPLQAYSFSPTDPTRNPHFASGTSEARRGNVTRIRTGIGAEVITSYVQYDIVGNAVVAIDPRGTAATVTYPAPYAYPTQWSTPVTEVDGSATTFIRTATYDPSTGAVLTTTGLNPSETVSYTYNDPLDRLTQTTRPAGAGFSTYGYSAPGSTLSVTESARFDATTTLTTTSEFDGLGRVRKTTRNDIGTGTVVSETTYDALGRAMVVTNPYRPGLNETSDGSTRTTYDQLSRVTRVESFTSLVGSGVSTGAVTTAYSFNEVTVTDQESKSRKSIADSLGRMTSVVEAPGVSGFGFVTNYGYDARGNLLTVNQGTQPARTFGYDSLGRLRTATMPECTGLTQYSYDPNGNLAQKIDPRGITTTFTYDEANRVKSKTYTGTTAATTTRNVRYVYDNSGVPTGVTAPPGFATFNRGTSKGRLIAVLSMATASDVETYTMRGYDLPGRSVRTRQLVDGTTYDSAVAVNDAGAPVTEDYPSWNGTTGTRLNYAYNTAGQMSSLQRAGVNLTSGATYAPAGGLTQQRLGNNLYHRLRYNSRLQADLISLGTTTTVADKLELAYSYGKHADPALPSSDTINPATNNGNIGRITISLGSGTPIQQDFAYDPLNRLLKAVEYYEPAACTAAPSAPTGIAASAGNAIVNVSWTDTAGTTNSETGFRLERSTDNGATWPVSFTPAANAVSYADTTVTNGTPYRYRVRADNTCGSSAYSTMTSNVTPSAGGCTATLTGISPNTGAQGQTLTGVVISGTNLAGATAVTFSGAGVTGAITATAPGSVTCTVTITGVATTGVRNVTVTTPTCGSPVLSSAFTVTSTNTDFALLFNGTTAYVRAADSMTLSLLPDLTVEAWIKPATVTGTQAIVSKRKAGTGGADYGGYELRLVGDKVVFETYKQSGVVKATITSTASVAAGSWFHVAGCFDETSSGTPGDGVIYVSVATSSGTTTVLSADPNTGGVPDGGSPLQIGRTLTAAGAGQTFFSGKIDEVRVSNAALYSVSGATPSKTLAVVTGQTKAMWRMNENTGTLTADATSGNVNPGTLMGSPLPTWTAGVTTLSKRAKRQLRLFELLEVEPVIGSGQADDTAESTDKTLALTQSWVENYIYDQYGNLKIGATAPGIDPATNRINEPGYAYDSAGNMTLDGNTGNRLYYDGENRLWKVETGGGTLVAQYVYDGEGRRVRKQVFGTGAYIMRFVYGLSGALIAEYTTSTAPGSPSKEYFYGPSGLLATSESGTMNFVTPDHLGSPRAITSAAATLLGRHDYRPFGDELTVGGPRSSLNGYASTDSARQHFTSKERDTETGLDFFQARYYGGSEGRFNSCDPLNSSGQAASPQTWNRYSYVYNNPLAYVDPSGMLADYYNQDGKLIGTDGNKDGKAYVVPDKNEVKQIEKANKGGGMTPVGSVTSAVALPSYDERQAIGAAVTASDSPNATDTKGGNHEEGGIAGTDASGKTVISPAVPGAANDLTKSVKGSTVSVDPFKAADPSKALAITNVTLVYHVHPKDTAIVSVGGKRFVNFYDQGPSMYSTHSDISQARAGRTQIVVGARDKTVYFYGAAGTIATLPLDKFLKIK